MNNPIGNTISHYKILEKLGEGGMGVVYKAEDTELKRTVAIKFLPPELTRNEEAKNRFIHEAQAASSLEHHNICTIHEIGRTEDDQLFVVMACYEGETLKSKIKDQSLPGAGKKTGLKIKEAIDIAIQIARGLEKAHEKGIVHRDIKPANIFITNDGIVKIIDFGLAKLAGRTMLTQEGSTLGTISYMSPEQGRATDSDHRTDIWSLGIVLYEMITGQLPFKAEYEQAVIYSIMNEDPEPVTALRSGVPMELERIILKAIAKDPAERYQNADDLAADLCDLQQILSTSGQQSRPTVARKTGPGRVRVRPWIAATAVAVLALAILLLIFLPGERKAKSERKMLIVLPFQNLGPPQNQYFAAGITEEITTRLASISQLGVISRTSANQYANTDKTIKQIGEEVGVDYVLEGSVRWSSKSTGPGRVRITPQLIRVSDDTHLWANEYDRVMDDIFKIQTDIAQNVVKELNVTLLESERLSGEKQPTKNLDAYHAYLRGLHNASKPHFSYENWLEVINNFKQAVELDSNFALAYAELAMAHARLYYLRQDLSERRRQLAKESAERAIHLDPKSPKVHVALGYYYLWAYRDHKKSLSELSIAEKSLPNSVEIMQAKASNFEAQGRWQEFISDLEKALKLSPRDASVALDLAFGYWVTRKYSQAIELCNKAIDLAPNESWPYLYKVFTYWSWTGANEKSRAALKFVAHDHDFYHWAWIWQEIGEKNFNNALDSLSTMSQDWISHKLWARPKSMFSAFIYEYLGKSQRSADLFDSARVLLEKKVQEQPNDPRYHSSLGIAYAGIGLKNEAIREGKRAVELLPLSQDAAYGIPYAQDLAIIYTMVGDYDAALKQIELLLSIPSWISPAWLQLEICFAPLYENPEFKKLIKKYSGNEL